MYFPGRSNVITVEAFRLPQIIGNYLANLNPICYFNLSDFFKMTKRVIENSL